MNPEGFMLQARGPYHFDRWQWPTQFSTQLGDLILEVSTYDDDPAPPDISMVAIAIELVHFAELNGELLLDLIYGHYRYAEEEGWLSFWNVPGALARQEVLSQVESIELFVRRDRTAEVPYEAGIFINPNWDPEHKLELRYQDGQILAVNGESFSLKGAVLYPT